MHKSGLETPIALVVWKLQHENLIRDYHIHSIFLFQPRDVRYSLDYCYKSHILEVKYARFFKYKIFQLLNSAQNLNYQIIVANCAVSQVQYGGKIIKLLQI